jgi:solute carrier family 25 aspartate/glutamate transporter 12/13
LFLVADRKRTGKVTLQDWSFFENLLSKPDAEYQIAFRLFDTRGEGLIKFDDFKKIYDANKDPNSLPFDWNSEWASLYTGGRKKRHDLTYQQFSQLLRGLQGERVRQAFQHFDKNGDGYIEPEEFQKIIEDTSAHKLSDHILENLHTLINATGGAKISYATVRAFQNVIQSMEQVEQIIRTAAKQSSDGTITREEFLNVSARSRRFSNFTPMETDILFHFAGMDNPSGRLGLSAFTKVLDSSWQTSDRFETEIDSTAAASGESFAAQALETAHHFALGSIAGAFGAFMVYPIDLVKTRMQNQRGAVGDLLYKNSLDCAAKVFRNEGFRGFYAGVSPQMIGVAPEKAIKLTVNDFVRRKLTDKETGKIWYPYEAIAGGTAGGCQVVSFFNRTVNLHGC